MGFVWLDGVGVLPLHFKTCASGVGGRGSEAVSKRDRQLECQTSFDPDKLGVIVGLVQEFGEKQASLDSFERICTSDGELLDHILQSDEMRECFTNGLCLLISSVTEQQTFASILQLLGRACLTDNINVTFWTFLLEGIGRVSPEYDEFAVTLIANVQPDIALPTQLLLDICLKTVNCQTQNACLLLLKRNHFSDLESIGNSTFATAQNFNCCCRLLSLCLANGVESHLVLSCPLFSQLTSIVASQPEQPRLPFLRILAAAQDSDLSPFIPLCMNTLLQSPDEPTQFLLLPLLDRLCADHPDLATPDLLNRLFEITNSGTFDNRLRAIIVITTIAATCTTDTLQFITQHLAGDLLSTLFDHNFDPLTITLLRLLHRVLPSISSSDSFLALVADIAPTIANLTHSQNPQISDAASMVDRLIQAQRNLLS